MSSENRSWEIVEKAMNNQESQALKKDLTAPASLPPDIIDGGPDGIIRGFRQKQISKQASLEMMREWYSSQLDIARHQLVRSTEIRKKEADVDAERFLSEINRKHLEFLRDIEFSNLEGRMEALENLGLKTAEMLDKLQSRDWPAAMREQIINGVTELHQRFFDKIMSE